MRRFQVIAVIMALFTAPVAAQEQVAVPLEQAGALAAQALLAGDTALALQIAEAVLAQNPDDRNALVVVAAAAPRAGDPAKGRRAGARAWAVSQSDPQKYEAARLTALAAANEERFTLSTFWLRRALTVAPNEAERARTLRDARAVTQRNPWSTQLSFSLVPSNNVNGGAEDETSTAPGNPTGTLSEDALALEGWRATLSFGVQYRLHQNEASRTTAGLQFQTARVWITEDTDVPDEAFDTNYYDLSLRHDRRIGDGSVSLRGSRGLFEYRDLDLPTQTTDFGKYDIWRVGVDLRFPISERTQGSLSFGREWLEYLSTGIGDVERDLISGGITYQFENRDRIGATIAFTDTDGDSVNFTSNSETVSASYTFGRPIELSWSEFFDLGSLAEFEQRVNFIRPLVGPVNVSVGAGLRWNDYPDYRLLLPVEGGRQDRTQFGYMTMGLLRFQYAGFTPTLRFDASKTDSNVSRFDRETYSVGLTISSQF